MVFLSCLDAMMLMTEGLPVTFVPEESLVATVRYDVVNVRGLSVPAFLLALHAQRMRLKVTLARLLPCSAVAPITCAAYLLRMQDFVFSAVLRTVWYEGWTARMLAWILRSRWHVAPPCVLMNAPAIG